LASKVRYVAVIDRIEGNVAVVEVNGVMYDLPKRLFRGAREGYVYTSTTGRSWTRSKRLEAAFMAQASVPLKQGPSGNLDITPKDVTYITPRIPM
jgi:hypothetical protein